MIAAKGDTMSGDATESTENILAQELLRGVSRSFALTIPKLPVGLREVVTNAYLLCRIVDTIEDEQSLSFKRKQAFFGEFIDVVNGKKAAGAFAERLYPLLSRDTLAEEKELIRHSTFVVQSLHGFTKNQQAVLKRCVTTMARGMLSFQEKKTPFGLENVRDLDTYCYYVAGVVGELLTDLFCDYSASVAKNREKLMALAPSFGQGLQMTNILKDLWDDHGRGACWLPQDVFQGVGFELKNLRRGVYDRAFGEGLAYLIGIAKGHLEDALAYTVLIPRNETGMRKFCLWALGMAILSLRNINKRRDYMSGSEVKVSRNEVKGVMVVTNAALRSNFLLKELFRLSTRGLPAPHVDLVAKDLQGCPPDMSQDRYSSPASSTRNHYRKPS